MPLLEWIGLGLLVAVLAVIVTLACRRILLVKAGAIDVCWRDTGSRPGSWTFGQARYSADTLLLFRSFSILPGPARRLLRSGVVLGDRRAPIGVEADLLPPGSVVVECHSPGSSVAQIAIGEVALTGLLSWVESAPQSQRADPGI